MKLPKRVIDGLDRVEKGVIHGFYLWAQFIGKPLIRSLGYCPDCGYRLERLPKVPNYPDVNACPRCDKIEFSMRRLILTTRHWKRD